MKATCIFCGNVLRIGIKHTPFGKKIFLAPICLTCRRAITEELGTDDWEQSEWWAEMKRMYYAERSQETRVELSCIPLADQRDEYFQDDICDLNGKPVRNLDGTIAGIVERLYRTYGYGSRNIHTILINTYKVKVSRRRIAYILADLKATGIQPDEDAVFWRTWHAKLAKLEKENRIT